MEEADDLSDNLAIIDHGKIIAEGSPQDLKGKVGKGDIIEFRLDEEHLKMRHSIVESLSVVHDVSWAKDLGKERISFSALKGLKRMSEFYDFLKEKHEVKMKDVVIRQNTLEDVFIELTGRELRN